MPCSHCSRCLAFLHTFVLPLWPPYLSHHLQVLPCPTPGTTHCNFLFLTPLRTCHVLLVILSWLPGPHQLSSQHLQLSGSGSTDLCHYCKPNVLGKWAPNSPGAQGVNLPPLGLCSKAPEHFFHREFNFLLSVIIMGNNISGL